MLHAVYLSFSMASKRQRSSGNWEFIIKRKGLLPRAVSLTFETEAEGDAYCSRLEALLDRGIVPPELVDKRPDIATISDALRAYLVAVPVSASDKPLLNALFDRVGSVHLRTVNYSWVESWVQSMKREEHLSPSTIRHYVGALARCLDWLTRRPDSTFVTNPIRLLPKRYATYNDADAASFRASENTAKSDVPVDVSRDRRLDATEEEEIRRILAGGIPAGRQRAMAVVRQGALEMLFDLALETAMRMREMYTLSLAQIDIEKRTIFLDKTKNGDRRQVPLTSVALDCIARYKHQVATGARGMEGFTFDDGLFFPWLDGNRDPSLAQLNTITIRLSRQFSRIFSAAGCDDLNFHDLRHEATSRLFERTRLSDVQIAKITGHKDFRMLSRYANLRGSDLADQLW